MKSSLGFSILSALALLIAAQPGLAESTASPAPEAGQVVIVDDRTLTDAIQTAFSGDPELAASQIKVETQFAVVHLSGNASATAKTRALALARQMPGVKEVRDSIKVQG
ncbi:BON domain-containing protein [Chitinimonas arctica]|uniref:BON domain-containing protein n=1 Tax=Chitinimonas arctica TaxID=2594795 RepID=A0A516SGZ3_9NEIS|nr:BON domain-containing protein [Chitinimonas arctica]QDQ27402.1 BON domain-containing protein [Chitinimonas arctica]